MSVGRGWAGVSRDEAAQARYDVEERRSQVDEDREVLTDQRRRAAVERDQAGLEPDRVADERDRAADERDRAADERDETADERDRAADERDRAADERDRAADERDRVADQRDQAAEHRDLTANRRDEVAEQRDDEGRRLEASLGGDLPSAARDHLELVHEEAAADRGQAFQDRRAAAGERDEAERDRVHAAADRDAALAHRHHAAADRGAWARELENAAVDGLTGAYSRAAGFRELEREIARANRGDHALIVAFLDVDGLKAINDTEGHAAGDQMLLDVVHALRGALRSSDVIMRYGGDEFVCVLPGATITRAEQRLTSVNGVLAEARLRGSVTIGLAELRDADSAEGLVARADAALYQQRQQRQQRFPSMRAPIR